VFNGGIEMNEFFGIFVIAWFVTAFFSYYLSENKGWGAWTGFFAALFFGPIVFLYYMGMPDLKLRKLVQDLRDQDRNISD